MTPWTQLTSEQKADAVRPLLERDGLSYGQAAQALGTTRVAIAGVVSRAKDRNQPIQHAYIERQTIARKKRTDNQVIAQKAAAARKVERAKAKPRPKKPHQGFVRFVGAGEPADAAPIKASAWDALEGSTPVSLEHRTGCAWPVEKPVGTGTTLFCNLPEQEGKSWCPTHYAMGARVVAVGTPVRRSAKPDRYSL